jgi:hypothetical protein
MDKSSTYADASKNMDAEGKHEEMTIKNAHKELDQAEKASAAVSRVRSRVHYQMMGRRSFC